MQNINTIGYYNTGNFVLYEGNLGSGKTLASIIHAINSKDNKQIISNIPLKHVKYKEFNISELLEYKNSVILWDMFWLYFSSRNCPIDKMLAKLINNISSNSDKKIYDVLMSNSQILYKVLSENNIIVANTLKYDLIPLSVRLHLSSRIYVKYNPNKGILYRRGIPLNNNFKNMEIKFRDLKIESYFKYYNSMEVINDIERINHL